MTSGSPQSETRRWFHALGGVAIALVVLEVASYLTIPVANRFLTQPIVTRGSFFESQSEGVRTLLESARRDQLDPLLGWRYRPGYAAGGDTINGAGMRSSREYALLPPDSVARVAAFGDSFIYCTEVSNQACWSSQLEAGWQVEALNYGVGGYGTDQAFLRYVQEGRAYRPETVVMGFAPVQLRRAVNRYPRFLTPNEGPWFKPRFQLSGEDLRLIPTPVASSAELRRLLDNPELVIGFGKDDYFYEPALYEHRLYRWSAAYRLGASFWIRARRRYFDPDRLFARGVFRIESAAYALQLRLMSDFADSIAASGAEPVVLLLPSRDDVGRWARGEAPVYAPLAARLADEGLRVVDPLAALAGADVAEADLFRPGGHYSAAGNRILAQVMAEALGLPAR